MNEIITIDLGMVNVYLLNTDQGFVLIDTGVSNFLPRIEKALSSARCTHGKLKLILLTHGDGDHVGNAITLKQEYGAKLAMHEGDYAMVKEGKPLIREAKGLIWKIMSRMSAKGGTPLPNFEIDQFLSDGQRLDEYGLAAQILHVPGHTPGSIAILTDDGHLFSGDIFSNQRKPALTPLVENREQILASVERIKQVHPKMVYPGHGKPFPGEALAKLEL